MTKRLIVPAILMYAMLICSCGTKKKLDASMKEADQLKTENSELKKENGALKSEVSRQTSANATQQKDLSQCQKDLKLVTDAMDRESEELHALAEKLDKALADFKERGVEVYEKNGLLYVSLSENLLYKSGSAALGTEGKKALGSLASVLNEYPKLKVVVLGNTDDVQIKKGADNWSLSTERANGVVRILRDDYKVDPGRLTSAGKGKYNPIADNKTEEGRAKNRRTDIILNPDWDRLWNSVKK